MKNECPCRYCHDRDETCHSTCERYKEYKEINDADREKRFSDKEKNDLLYNPKIAKAVYRKWSEDSKGGV